MEELQNREKAPFLGLLPTDSMLGTAKKPGSQMHHFWRQQSLWWHSQPCFWPCSLTIYLLIKTFPLAYIHAARIHFPASLAVGCGHKTELRTTDYGLDVCHSTRSGPLAHEIPCQKLLLSEGQFPGGPWKGHKDARNHVGLNP